MRDLKAIAEQLLNLFHASLETDLREERNVHLHHFLNIAIGITWGIARAQSLHFDPTRYDARITQLSMQMYKLSRDTALKGIIGGTLTAEPNWAGGYYFNSSIYRLDALGQVLSKFIHNAPDDKRRRQRGSPRVEHILINSHPALRQIADERNRLDHERRGLMFKRRVFYPTMLEGLGILVDILAEQIAASKKATRHG